MKCKALTSLSGRSVTITKCSVPRPSSVKWSFHIGLKAYHFIVEILIKDTVRVYVVMQENSELGFKGT